MILIKLKFLDHLQIFLTEIQLIIKVILVTCEHGARRVTTTDQNNVITLIADEYNEKRLNSPNDVVFIQMELFFLPTLLMELLTLKE